MLLWFGAFLLARREWWIAATVLAALSTGVRPVGIFAAVALIAFLVKRKEWIVLAWSSFVSTVIALLYIATAQTFASSPWFSFTLYRERAWGANGLPIALPLMAIMSSIDRLLTETRWTVWIPDFIWFAMSLVLIAFYLRAKTVRTYTVERVATLAYLVFFFCYNYDLVVAYWPRFMLPVLPVLLVSVRDRLPADRRLVWPAALLVALLASSSIVTFRSVFGFSLHR